MPWVDSGPEDSAFDSTRGVEYNSVDFLRGFLSVTLALPKMIVTQELSDIYKPIKQEISLFNEMIERELASHDIFIQSIHNYLLQISGKHLRPAITILCARLCGNTSDLPIRLAIAIELLHTATLIHDDIIDGSMYRRNQLSMNAKWGNEVSIICGDYLYAKSFSLLSILNDTHINKMFSDCARTMCEGEMKQVETRKRLEMSEETYTEIILKKTASLFETACAVGGFISKQPPAMIQALNNYGKNFGLAFQITDDCLDIIGLEKELGKKTGLDFEKKDPTLPLIYLHQKLNPGDKRELLELMACEEPQKTLENFKKIQKLCVSGGIVQKCMFRAREYADRATDHIEHFPDSVYRRSLVDLVHHTLQRA